MIDHRPHSARSLRARTTLSLLLCASMLAGCNKAPDSSAQTGGPAVAPPIAALPLATATPPETPLAPDAAALPQPARPLPVTAVPRERRYRYIDQADAMGQAFGDTPPDYTVDYGGTRPWIWRADNGAYRVVEQLPEGQRDYYYEPGADQPFLVQDPSYAYAYDGGELVGVYGPDGRALDDAVARQRAYDAGRYLDRARGLYRAAQSEQRQAAYQANWDARRQAVNAQQQRWDDARAHDAEWQRWHDANQQAEQRQWQHEHDRRLAYAAAAGVGAGVLGAALIHRSHDRQDEQRTTSNPPYPDRGPGGDRQPSRAMAEQARLAQQNRAAMLQAQSEQAGRQRQADADARRHADDLARKQADATAAAQRAAQKDALQAQERQRALAAAQDRKRAIVDRQQAVESKIAAEKADAQARKQAVQAHHEAAQADQSKREAIALAAEHRQAAAQQRVKREASAQATKAQHHPHGPPAGTAEASRN